MDAMITRGLRVDRLATLYFFHPLRLKARRAAPGVPILMYHSVSGEAENGVHPYFRTCTSPERFAGQMRFLRDNGYKVVSLKEAIGRMGLGQEAVERCAVITFDDGFRDFYLNAFPVLRDCGFTSTVFLPTAYIGNERAGLKGREHLSWGEVRELGSMGVSFGSHTVTHPQLRLLGKRSEVEREISVSKAVIEDETGAPVESFSYPYAFPEEDREFTLFLREALQGAGYSVGVSTRVGMASVGDDALFLSRIPVNDCDDEALLRAKLEGGYDWLHEVQYLLKMAKRRLGQRGAASF